MVLHNFYNFSTKVIGLFCFLLFGFFFFGGGKKESNLHLHRDYIKEKYKSNFKTMFSFYSNQFKASYKL